MRISRFSASGLGVVQDTCPPGWVGPKPCRCANPPLCATTINAKYAGRVLSQAEHDQWVSECGQIGYMWSSTNGCEPSGSVTKWLPWALGGFALLFIAGIGVSFYRAYKGLPEPGTGRVYFDLK